MAAPTLPTQETGFNSPSYGTVCIVGVGLIGGSFGLAVKKHGIAGRVIGVARTAATIEKAIACGAIDEGFDDVAAAAREADFVFLAPPVAQMHGLCEKIAPALRAGAIVTDAGSTKADIVRDCSPLFQGKAAFVAGHPMAGSEQSGVEAARADLFEGAMWLLTPTPRTADYAVSNLKKLIETLGAKPLLMDPDTHDQLVAVASHVPHVVASALMHVFLETKAEHEQVQELVASGWRDATRVAAGSPEMWRDICLANGDAVATGLGRLILELDKLRDMLQLHDADGVLNWFEAAADERRKVGYLPRTSR